MAALESWRKSWRDGFAPLIGTEELQALRTAVATDDPRLVQGCTTQPPPLMCVQDWPVEAGCAIGFCGAMANGGLLPLKGDEDGEQSPRQGSAATVADAEEYFAKACQAADQKLGELAGCRWFLAWFDETPRDDMRRELLPEIDRELARRKQL